MAPHARPFQGGRQILLLDWKFKSDSRQPNKGEYETIMSDSR